MKKRDIIIISFFILGLIIVCCGIFIYNKKELVVNKEDNIVEKFSTVEIPDLTMEDEENLEEQEVEEEGFELQGEIAYEEGEKGEYLAELGEKRELTYYSQVDQRWKNVLYTSTGNNTQTIGSSGCGPTAAAMVVSSVKGIITPNVIADLFVENGYRSVNSGTYWSAFRWTADVFDIEYCETSNLEEVKKLLEEGNYVIVSCGNGLFTSGGHFIVIVGIEGGNFKIYDPYLYNGKFDVSTRKGKVEIKGNMIYCSVLNFKQYSNYKNFFAYKGDMQKTKENFDIVLEKSEEDIRYVNAKSGLNVRNLPNGIRVDGLVNGTKVIVYEMNNKWCRIGKNRWVYSDYLIKDVIEKKDITGYKAKVIANSGLNIRIAASIYSARSGGYLKGTIVTIYEEYNGWGKTDKGWVNLKYVSKNFNNVNSIKKFRSNTIIFSNSNLSGEKYYYLANTSVQILEQYQNVDKILVNKTGRIGYVLNNVYK